MKDECGNKLSDTFVFKQKNEIIEVCCTDIVFFESARHYIKLHMKDGTTYLARGTIASLSEIMDGKIFIRVHRTVVVNLEYADKIKQNEVLLNSIWKRVPVSRSYKRKLEEALEGRGVE